MAESYVTINRELELCEDCCRDGDFWQGLMKQISETSVAGTSPVVMRVRFRSGRAILTVPQRQSVPAPRAQPKTVKAPEASAAGFPCPDCDQVCMTKSGRTQHRQKKHS